MSVWHTADGDFQSHILDWEPGNHGKGLIARPNPRYPYDDAHPDPVVVTWNTEQMEPSHDQTSASLVGALPAGTSVDRQSYFHLSPEGKVWFYGTGRGLPDEDINYLQQVDPLITGRRDEVPAVVDNGYGHAEQLMRQGKALRAEGASRKIAKFNWRDSRRWGDYPPDLQAFAHLLKKAIPNTKYGNLVAPWFFEQYKNETLSIGWGDDHESLTKAIEGYQKAKEEGDREAMREHRENIAYHKENLDPTDWTFGDVPAKTLDYDYGGNLDLEDAIKEMIEHAKATVKEGKQFHHKAVPPERMFKDVSTRRNDRVKTGGKVMYEFPDGWTIRRLTKGEQARYEGRMMDNCVGDYASDVDYGSSEIYTLRDPKHKPHVTWQHEKDHYSETTKASDIYGKGNEEPKPIYKARLRHYYEQMPPNKRPKSERGSGYVSSHTKIGVPTIDDYGLETDARPHWRELVRSAWEESPTGEKQMGYYPENIQKIVDHAAGSADIDTLWSNVHHLAEPYRELTEVHGAEPHTLNSLNESSYVQTLLGFQNAIRNHHALDFQEAIDRNPALDAPFRFQPPQPVVASAGMDREHIGTNGKKCNCSWGARSRPSWDDEWENHTNWIDDEELSALAIHLAKLY